jgi:hypothetical protein
MREMGPASDEEMVLSFLRAEIDSPRRGPHYMAILMQMRADRWWVNEPSPDSSATG